MEGLGDMVELRHSLGDLLTFLHEEERQNQPAHNGKEPT